MLRHELVTEAQALLEDPAYWTAARLTTLFNRGMRDLSNYMGLCVPAYMKFQSVEGQQQYMLPYDYIANQNLSFEANGTTNVINLKPSPNFIYGQVHDPDEEGTPYLGFIWAKEDIPELWIYPTFDDDNIDVDWFYWRRPPSITNDNDRPLIPVNWHTFLVDYAVNYTYVQDRVTGWTFSIFETWWLNKKIEIRMSDSIQDAENRDVRFGIMDDQIPKRNDGDIFQTSDDWS